MKTLFLTLLLSAALPLTAASTPALIETDDGASSLLIAAAANSSGLNGTVFHSDLMLLNQEGTPRRVAIYWLASGQNNAGATPLVVTVPAHSVSVLNDFVATLLGREGIGAVLLRTVDSGGSYDPNGRIDAFSRIWSPQPGSTGQVSQPFPALDETKLGSHTGLPAYALGLRQNDSFRTNVGIVNMSTTATNTYTVFVAGTGGSTSFGVSVPPRSLVQVPVPAGNWGDFYISVVSTSGAHEFAAYGSSVDNVTGDAWSSPATFSSGLIAP